MRIKNKSLIVDVRTPPGARNFGSFLRNGSGISASNWGTRSIPHPCARRNLLLPRSLRLRLSSSQHASGRLHRRFSLDLRNGHVLLLREAFQVQLFSHNRMERCVAPPIIHSLHKSADQNATARCRLCMQHVLVIVVHARCASSVKNRQQPSKLGGSVRFIGLSLQVHRSQRRPHLHQVNLFLHWFLIQCSGETGSGVSIGGSWESSLRTSALRSVWLTPLPQLSPPQIDHFLEHNGHITGSPGHCAWPAMLHGIPRLLSPSRSLGYRMPRPQRSDSRRADIISESAALQVLSSVRFSFPSRSPCSLFHADLLFFHIFHL